MGKRFEFRIIFNSIENIKGIGPKTVKLINEGKFREAAAEFLNNDEYRNAVEKNRRGIRRRMKDVYNLLRREGAQSMLSDATSA